MRLINPTWYQWLQAVQATIETAINRAGIPGFKPLTGVDSNLVVKAVDSDFKPTKMPYVRTYLTGWEPEDTQNHLLESDYSLQTNAAIQTAKSYNEILKFSLMFYSEKANQILDMTQAIVSYLGFIGNIFTIKNDITYQSLVNITDYTFDLREGNDGNIDYYSTELEIQLKITSDRLVNDAIKPVISSIVVSSESTIPGSDESDDDQFTITNGD